MGEQKVYHDVNDDYKIDFHVPGFLKELMDKAEDADMNGQMGLYLALADAIDTQAKNCYVEGILTKYQWEYIVARYPQ